MGQKKEHGSEVVLLHYLLAKKTLVIGPFQISISLYFNVDNTYLLVILYQQGIICLVNFHLICLWWGLGISVLKNSSSGIPIQTCSRK